MSLTTTCPYCNAVVDISESAPPRVACPRCGETFPSNRSATTQSALPQPVSPASISPASSPKLKRANLKLGLLVGGGMVLLFALALLAILNTRSKRGLESLAEMPTLGYLPADSNVIAAVNVPIAEDSNEGKEMLDRLGVAPGGVLDMERYFGLKRDDIEDAVLGMHVESNLIPPMCLVVRTRSRYDAAKLREKLNATRSKTEGAKSIDLIRLPGVLGEAALWCPTPRTFIICRPAEEIAKVPDVPTKGVEHLSSQPLVELLSARSDRDTFLWLVAHSNDWQKTSLAWPLLSLKMTPEDRQTLFSVRTVGVGLRLDRGAVTTRARPARISEEVKPEKRGIAVDLVVKTAGDTAALDVRKALEDRLEKLNLEIKDSNLKENRYSVTISAKPAEWEQAAQLLTKPAK